MWKPLTVSLPATLSDDRTEVITSNGSVWVHVRHPRKLNTYYFIRKEKVNADTIVMAVQKGLGVIENTIGHFPIRIKLEKLLKLIEMRGARHE